MAQDKEIRTQLSSQQDKDYKFEYVEMASIFTHCWSDIAADGIPGSSGGFILNWGAHRIGFGQLKIYLADGKIRCDNECMKRSFCRAALRYLAESLCPDGMAILAKAGQEIQSLSLSDFEDSTCEDETLKSGSFTFVLTLPHGKKRLTINFAERGKISQAQWLLPAFERLAEDMILDDER